MASFDRIIAYVPAVEVPLGKTVDYEILITSTSISGISLTYTDNVFEDDQLIEIFGKAVFFLLSRSDQQGIAIKDDETDEKFYVYLDATDGSLLIEKVESDIEDGAELKIIGTIH